MVVLAVGFGALWVGVGVLVVWWWSRVRKRSAWDEHVGQALEAAKQRHPSVCACGKPGTTSGEPTAHSKRVCQPLRETL